MTNPFKFGTVVSGSFFTNRKEEISRALSVLASENHLVIISPRRFGKTSLIYRVLEEVKRPSIVIDLQLVTGREDLAAQLIKKIYHLYPLQKLKQLIKRLKIIPSISLDPMTNEVEISFKAGESEQVILEDVLNLINDVGSKKNKLVVVMDEFQEIKKIGKNLDKQLRSILQNHNNVNYVFLGSQESLMKEIFEKKKSPFYHFGYLMTLDKIPAKEFETFLGSRLKKKGIDERKIASEILSISGSHPYYSQQLAFNVWEGIMKCEKKIDPVLESVEEIIRIHDMDFERLWGTINLTDKKILVGMAVSSLPPLSAEFSRKFYTGATSTIFSGLKRLIQTGLVTRSDMGFEIDDPFFKKWIQRRRGM